VTSPTAGSGWLFPGICCPTRHVGDLRILQHQQIITLDELTGLVVVKVLALVGDFAVSGRGGTIPARIGDVLAVAKLVMAMSVPTWLRVIQIAKL
jgi:hypothetical protein